MADSAQAPATKQDVRLLMEQMGKYYEKTHREMTEWKEEFHGTVRESEDRTKRHFDVVVEDIKHDFQGAFHDKLEQHDDRILRLEHHVGLVA